ncbi:helix-turn-helix transcriptional regulator [Actinokineospora sp. PR83]|uniref:helix-turn-helix domain-containing protein n=1 Tax=Actinokineospora sp. PR83 TaxID=2884908 RepID=UPI001F408A13|nr:Scr1 family TA system antitoxin-like transcriptional regulator [Actinokineospora sp. PR83]MCG8915726.1 helix-turn-helix transcriptional regulator [Actinokineospora sp. PR83]
MTTSTADRAPSRDDTVRAKTLRGLILARRLDAARLRCGFTTRQLATAMSMSPAMINRIMTGRRVPTALEIGGLCALLDIAPQQRQVLYALRATAEHIDWIIRHPIEGREVLHDLEAMAATITTHDPTLIPGPLRTAAYRDAIGLGDVDRANDVDRAEAVDQRQTHFFLPARVLDNRDLPREVLREQLRHLIGHRAHLRVLPRTVPHPGFRLFDIDNFSPVVHIEHQTTSVVLEHPASTVATRDLVAHLREFAHPEGKTAEILTGLLDAMGR